MIVEEPHLRNLFGDFLRHNFCEENLLYWIAVVDFRKKFGVTSSAVAANASSGPSSRGNKHSPGQAAMERHHDLLITQAHGIYKQFLASGASSELNIDHALRNELTAYLNSVVKQLTGKPFSGRVELEHMAQFNATQLQMLISLYERIQTHVFRLMATDSVPKFIKTTQFLAVRRQYELEFDRFDHEEMHARNPAHPPGLDANGEETGGAYMTMSTFASEREQRDARPPGSTQELGAAPAPPAFTNQQ